MDKYYYISARIAEYSRHATNYDCTALENVIERVYTYNFRQHSRLKEEKLIANKIKCVLTPIRIYVEKTVKRKKNDKVGRWTDPM